jgi:predicted nucleic acid-binding protein
MIFVDTSVLLDTVTNDPVWENWSHRQLDAASLRDRLVINPVVYAELSAAFKQIDELEAVLARVDIAIAEMSRPALFLAGQAFKSYRRRGGMRTTILPDFFVGAQAVVLGAPLITRDVRRYRSYFPIIELVSPK